MVIKKIKNLVKWFFGIKFFCYCFSGGVAAIVDLSIFYTLNELFNVYYLAALPISFTVAAVVNYTLQRKITFKNSYQNKCKQLAVFVVLQAVGLTLNGIVTAIQVEFLEVWPTLARFIAIFVILIYNYLTSKFITFGKMK